MHCARFAQLLPLYASGDLDAAAFKRTEAHLQSCAGCARTASEYKGVPQLARLYAAPDFGDDFFERVRRNVMREIETPAPPAGLAHRLSRFFPRTALAFAAAVALLVVTSAVVLSLYDAGRRGAEPLRASDAPRTPAATNVGAEGRGEASGRSESASLSEATNLSEAASSPATVVGSADTASHARVKASQTSRVNRVEFKQAGWRAKAPAATAAAPAATRDTASASQPAVSHAVSGLAADAALASAAAEADDAARPAPEAMRIEMQTRDPNVRIIWLVNQPSAN